MKLITPSTKNDLFSVAMNVPLSVWYLKFYCNPRMQEAVLNKILMDGFGVTADLYRKYAETYIHHEKEATNIAKVDVDENKSGKGECFYLLETKLFKKNIHLFI